MNNNMVHYPYITNEIAEAGHGSKLQDVINDAIDSFLEWCDGLFGEHELFADLSDYCQDYLYSEIDAQLEQILQELDLTDSEYSTLEDKRVLLDFAQECEMYSVFSEDKRILKATNNMEACERILDYELDSGLVTLPNFIQGCIDYKTLWNSWYRHSWSCLEYNGVSLYYMDS